MSMQHVTTQKVLTSVHVILGSVVTDLYAMVGYMIDQQLCMACNPVVNIVYGTYISIIIQHLYRN